MRIMHVITALNLGGAETMLYRLLQAREATDSHEVVSLIDVGSVGQRISRLGIQPHALRMHRTPNPLKIVELARLIAKLRPDLVQTWMYHADLVGGLAARLDGSARVVWGIHHSTLDRATSHRMTHLVVSASARLSRLVPDAIVCVSEAARTLHVAKGYDATKFIVIPNGFDLSDFRPDPTLRHEMRLELGLAEDHVLIGMVARVSPQKDHLTFIRAAALLARRHAEARFLLCGGPGVLGGMGATQDNPMLCGALREAGLLDRFFLLGQRADVGRVLVGMDIAALSSSFGEAFPLVVGEAMASGVPCVVTDVGDSGFLVGETGRVVPPCSPEALARGWEELLELGPEGRKRLGHAARERIERHFSLSQVAAQYSQLWRHIVSRNAGTLGGAAARQGLAAVSCSKKWQ
jgi:glycosyltransferase involved in cell wall biosynthesis